MMATATKPKPSAINSSNKKIKFMGPAQKEYKSFLDQCIDFMQMYCENWNSYVNPSSYIIPPVFYYKHPDVSDEAITIVEQLQILYRTQGVNCPKKIDPLLKHRTSDNAEHIVFTALQQLVEDKVRAPIIVVHNLNIQAHQKLIPQLFPIVNEAPFRGAFENCKREYDFLIIGPSVGIVAIEVKSSKYTTGSDFTDKDSRLPKRYYEGIQQLEPVNDLFQILGKCAEIVSPNVLPIRKFIFTPNLYRKRYDTWMNSISDDHRETVKSNKIKDVMQWFTEDMNNLSMHSKKPPLYSTLRNILETGSCMSCGITEKYALLLFGFRSMVLFGNTDLKLDVVHISQNESLLAEHKRIHHQNPLLGHKKPTLSDYSLLKPIEELKLNYEPKVVFLSPDQQAAFEGPARQFIIGAAGTGKTVVLQAKALDLLSKGEEVVVFSPECYKANYEKLFDSYGFKNYQCLAWPQKDFEPLHQHFFFERESLQDSISKTFRSIWECVEKQATSNMFDWLMDKNVMIDDANDPILPDSPNAGIISCTSIYVTWALVTYANAVNSTKIIWVANDSLDVAMDFNTFGSIDPSQKETVQATLKNEPLNDCLRGRSNIRIDKDLRAYKTILLRQVMRCSQSVYRTAYPGKHLFRWFDEGEPILAHKIQGHIVVDKSEYRERQPQQAALNRMWGKIDETLLGLSREGDDLSNVAVIIGLPPRAFVEPISPKATIEVKKIPVPVLPYYNVSSMEWPIVIYATVFPDILLYSMNSIQYKAHVAYPRYRAMSRATTKLFDITVTYKDLDSSPFLKNAASASK